MIKKPIRRNRDKPKRNLAVLKDYNAGELKIREIAEKYSINRSRVYAILKSFERKLK